MILQSTIHLSSAVFCVTDNPTSSPQSTCRLQYFVLLSIQRPVNNPPVVCSILCYCQSNVQSTIHLSSAVFCVTVNPTSSQQSTCRLQYFVLLSIQRPVNNPPVVRSILCYCQSNVQSTIHMSSAVFCVTANPTSSQQPIATSSLYLSSAVLCYCQSNVQSTTHRHLITIPVVRSILCYCQSNVQSTINGLNTANLNNLRSRPLTCVHCQHPAAPAENHCSHITTHQLKR
jgi:hypothetical protein